MKPKGFIGAIGDDLPSLIPIFIGLLIFFAVFLNTYNTYKQNTAVYDIQQEAISIASVMKEEPLISDYSQFARSCNMVNTTANWNAFLVPLDINTSVQDDLQITKENLSENVINIDGNIYSCYDLEEFTSLSGEKYSIVYMFPITMQKNLHSIPARLYITVWS